jgi:hypothetical protein
LGTTRTLGRPFCGRLQEGRLALREQIVLAHKPLNFLGIHDHALALEHRCHASIAIEDVFEANALDQVAQLAVGGLAVLSGEAPIVG